ncbi:peptidase S41 family protein [Biscogniauxia mediterranea]|nr:peptidase S41 family protein [Biscogniauxia mediterranea]
MRREGPVIAELSSPLTRIIWCFITITVAFVSAAPTSSQPFAPTATSNPSACAQISPATASLLAASPSASPTVPASLAIECLRSVPNKPGPAKRLITSLKAFVEWQSTLAWLKDPPASYMLPPVDIQGGLDNISATATAGGFASEYDFQLAIVQVITAAHDGHFSYRPDIFKAFRFGSKLASDIVSVSKDGLEVPKLYHRADLASNATKTPVAITKINGQDAVTFISDLNSKFSVYQDPDSQWNTQFATYANPDGALVVAASIAFQGSSVTLTYEDGQQKSEDTFARLSSGVDFSGIKSGEDFYNRFCNPESEAAAAAAANSTAAPAATTSAEPGAPEPTISGYPPPVVRDSGSNTTSGYFLNGTGYDDVAVLSVSSFAPAGNVDSLEYLTNFQDTVESFLSQSSQAGKKRLVIDVTANGGGFVVAGYELFAQLFPDVEQFGAANLRLSDSLVNIARISASIPANFQPTTVNERLALQILAQNSITTNLIPGGVESPDGEMFTTVDEIISPVTLKNDRFTAYQNTPLDMPASDFNLTGTGSRSNPPAAVFSPENVVILTDGTCGSTCTLFSYLLLFQLNVKTVAVGGRPQTGPMQSIAGVEGAQVFELSEISSLANAVIELAPQASQTALLAGELGVLADGYALKRGIDPSSAGAVNGKNAFSPSDSQTPLQFLYEPANCRFFYTADMLSKPELVWQRAVDATWTSPQSFCVQGSQMAVNQTKTVDPLFQLTLNKTKATNNPENAAAAATATPPHWLILLVLVGGATLVSCL